MKFGMPTLIELATLEETAALCGQLGLSFLELNTNFPRHQPHLLDPEKLNALAAQYSAQITSRLLGEYRWLHFLGSDIRQRRL